MPYAVLCAVVFAVLAWPASARDVTGLYSARVAVSDRSPEEFARATRAALAEVLVKLTGERAAARDGAAARLLDKARDLLLKFGYESVQDTADMELVVEFDERAVREELARLDVTLWGKERPDTLIWLVVDDGEQRFVPSSDDPGAPGETVLARGERRGIPLLLPLMDIAEIQQTREVGGDEALAPPALLALAARYGTPAVLVAMVRQSAPGVWEASWELHIDGERQSWQQDDGGLEPLLDEGIDRLADALARRYADPGMLARADTLQLKVTGIDSAQAYARVVNYLDELDTVANLFVVAVDSDRLALRVEARSGRTGFAQSIAFGRVLAPVAGADDTYRLLR